MIAALKRTALVLPTLFAALVASGETLVIGWNDLGMHCMDGSDFSVFSILPPYNTVDAHILQDGQLVTSTNAHFMTYKAVADATGSINSTTADKINFWDYEDDFFGVQLDLDQGLTGLYMPGTSNTPQHAHFNSTFNWFAAEGIPISPYDDEGRKNYYPMFRLEARDAESHTLAQTDVVLPVSDEMHCAACHHSGGDTNAEPLAGWAWECDGDRDYKLNVLRLHDQHRGQSTLYAEALATAGYHTNGLYASVRVDAKAVICAKCHPSNALPGLGLTNVTYFTSVIHARHADVQDPDTGLTLESASNRAACYRCHPGSETRCLRGAMGKAVAADGTMAMSCQSCHGPMSEVGSTQRDGWFDEPNCQACHTGTATDNNGQIRYTSVYTSPGTPRIAQNATFATTPDTPASGKSLYRFSAGHGGLQCAACHGSPHAVYPTSHENDNVQSTSIQGHEGTLVECSSCHGQNPQTFLGGPHGMHPAGASDFAVKRDGRENWHHKQVGEDSTPEEIADCRACHGTDYRGTELSRAHADREIATGNFGTLTLWRGQTVGCYACHNGPFSEVSAANAPPTAAHVGASTTANTSTNMTLAGADPESGALTWRVISQPASGTVGITGSSALYTPFTNFIGTDVFTFAATDPDKADSNLATGTVTVVAGIPTFACEVVAPTSVPVHVSAPFRAAANLINVTGAVDYAWTFGDGATGQGSASACHRFCTTGVYDWVSIASAAGLAVTNTGTIAVVDTVIDEDADGIGDYWELAWHGRLGKAGPDSDTDGDGATDHAEWQSGTIPTDDGSLLEFTAIDLLPAPGELRLTWASVSNRVYSIQQSGDLMTGSPAVVASDLVADPPTNTRTTAMPVATGFYRITTSLDGACPVLP